MNAQARLDRAALHLSVIQFFFVTTWVVYVIYLGDLLDRVGIGRGYLIWFIQPAPGRHQQLQQRRVHHHVGVTKFHVS